MKQELSEVLTEMKAEGFEKQAEAVQGAFYRFKGDPGLPLSTEDVERIVGIMLKHIREINKEIKRFNVKLEDRSGPHHAGVVTDLLDMLEEIK